MPQLRGICQGERERNTSFWQILSGRPFWPLTNLQIFRFLSCRGCRVRLWDMPRSAVPSAPKSGAKRKSAHRANKCIQKLCLWKIYRHHYNQIVCLPCDNRVLFWEMCSEAWSVFSFFICRWYLLVNILRAAFSHRKTALKDYLPHLVSNDYFYDPTGSEKEKHSHS